MAEADTTPRAPSKSWQELGDEFHLMVGYCIAAWARIDDELFRIFRACVGPYKQSAIIYYRTPGLDMRLGLTDELVLSVLPKKDRKSGGHDHPSVKAWKAAKSGFSDLLAIRRRIAHHPAEVKTAPYGRDHRLGWDPSPAVSFEIYASQH